MSGREYIRANLAASSKVACFSYGGNIALIASNALSSGDCCSLIFLKEDVKFPSILSKLFPLVLLNKEI